MPEVSIVVVHGSAIVRHAMAVWLAGKAQVKAFSSFPGALSHCSRSPCTYLFVSNEDDAQRWSEHAAKGVKKSEIRMVGLFERPPSIAEEQKFQSFGALASFHLPTDTSADDTSTQSRLVELIDQLNRRRNRFVTKAAEVGEASLSRRENLGAGPRNEGAAQNYYARPRLIAIGVSTGGPEALQVLLPAFPADSPPVLIVQHMPPGYTALLAKSLDEHCPCSVIEAKGGEPLETGRIFIAPAGENHLEVGIESGRLVTHLSSGPPRNRHRPSVDVLFESLVATVGGAALGILLTGMGEDGAEGLLNLSKCGARTIAQDEKTSRVFGMPRAAIALGAVREVYGIDEIAANVFGGPTGAQRRVG